MSPSTWSEARFFIRIEDTPNIAFIRCRDLPQPSATEVVPSTLGIKELFAKITECCRLAKPIVEATHVLYDLFGRPIENEELLHESLGWLVEGAGCPTLWTVWARDNCQRTFADSSTQTSESHLLPASSPAPVACNSPSVDALIPNGSLLSTSTASPTPTPHHPTATACVSVPASEQAMTVRESSTSDLADLGSSSATVPPPLEPTITSPLPVTSERVENDDAGKIASPAPSLPLRVILPETSQGVAEAGEPNPNATLPSVKENLEHFRTIKKARIAGNSTTAAAAPTKMSDEHSTHHSTISTTHSANDYRYRKRPATFDAEGAARYHEGLAGDPDRNGEGANVEQPIVLDGTTNHSLDRIDDDPSAEDEAQSEEAEQREVLEQTGYDAFDQAMAKDKFDQWNPEVWPTVCELFRQPLQEREERQFTHITWLRRHPYSYQCYGAHFLLMTERRKAGVLLADEMGLGKTMTVMVALATISTIMSAHKNHEQCAPDSCTASRTKEFPCPKSPLSPGFSRWKFRNLPTLIIVPTGTINVWEAEFNKSVAPTYLEVRKSHGEQFAWFDDLLVEDDGTPWQKNKPDRPLYKVVVLTTKESLQTRVMAQLEKVDGRKRVIARLKFARVIVDESHEIRNVNTRFVKNLEQLCRDGRTAMWFMTGTPLPKGPGSVKANFLCWSNCSKDKGLVGKLDRVLAKYNSSARQLEKASDEGNEAADRGLATQAEALAEMLKPYMLQRTAETRFRGHALLDVPKMKSEQVKLNFVDQWAARWQAYYHSLQGQMEKERVQRRAEALRNGTTPRPVLFLNHLRMARIYAGIPGLMDYRGAWTVEDIKKKIDKDGNLFTLAQIQHLYNSSAKLQALVEECRRLGMPTTKEPNRQGNSSEKLVVFASTPIEAHIIKLTLRKIAGVASTLVERSMRPPVRLSVINNSFQGNTGAAEFDVLVGTFDLIAKSYTMVRAQTAILFGPEWVEATEKQAQYRIKRIGQSRETRSVRYQMKSSIEGLIVRRQQYRSTFDDRVLGHDVPGRAPLSLEELMNAVEDADTV